MDGKILAKAREQLARTHEQNVAEHFVRQDRIYSRIPEIRRIDERLRSQMSELVGLTIKRQGNIAVAVARLEKESLALQARRAELLCEYGYPADYLDDIYNCKECKDTGFIGSKMCRCLHEAYNRALTSELSTLLKTSDECFENFDLSLYGEARVGMSIVYETCREYAHSFSERSMNLLFQGGTGLGKTFLSACIARVVSESGFSVVYDTAISIFAKLENDKFRPDEETAAEVRRCESCDLLILDDLGTEMTTSFVQSALYQLVNGRMIAGRSTIISTNLAPEELGQRYGAAILSRIEGGYEILPFFGEDIRRKR